MFRSNFFPVARTIEGTTKYQKHKEKTNSDTFLNFLTSDRALRGIKTQVSRHPLSGCIFEIIFEKHCFSLPFHLNSDWTPVTTCIHVTPVPHARACTPERAFQTNRQTHQRNWKYMLLSLLDKFNEMEEASCIQYKMAAFENESLCRKVAIGRKD